MHTRAVTEQVWIWMWEGASLPPAKLTAPYTHNTLVHQGKPTDRHTLRHKLVEGGRGVPQLVLVERVLVEEEQLVLVSSEAIVYFCFAGCTEAASHTQPPPSRS